ncbi:MAG TPA: alpha/beta hydrolase [Polyangia bacterium]|jgi:predicted alpha/beta hydrolase family esterase|nr:alpha/beta hydrolase [Polyangia bacterium]
MPAGFIPVRILVLPGLGGSGPGHWQTRWEACEPSCARVEQRDWDRPNLAEWLRAADEAIAAAGGPVVLVAHSLACSLVAHGARRPAWAPVVGALLVAPADVDSPAHTPDETRGFAPIPTEPLPFPATVVSSRNDPYVSFERARELAGRWRAQFVDAGSVGHINADSGLGEWMEGRRLLGALIARAVIRESGGGAQ